MPLNITEAAAVIPAMWSHLTEKCIEASTILTRRLRRTGYTVVSFEDDWTHVEMPEDGDIATRSQIKIKGRVLHARITRYRFVPDDVAQAEWRALLDKWQVEGHEQWVWAAKWVSDDGSEVVDYLGESVPYRVRIHALIDQCVFLKEQPLGDTVNVLSAPYTAVVEDS